jgi:hypothetical protein
VVINGDAAYPPGKWEVEAVKRETEGDTLKPGEVLNSDQNGGRRERLREAASAEASDLFGEPPAFAPDPPAEAAHDLSA